MSVVWLGFSRGEGMGALLFRGGGGGGGMGALLFRRGGEGHKEV